MYCDLIRSEFSESIELMKVFSGNDELIKSVQDAAKIFSKVFKNGGKVLSCGNGGSHCNAMHFSEELTGRYRKTRRGYPAIAISDPAYFSCVSNDFGYEYVFSRYLESVATSGDALLSISTSGKSSNILNAINSASLLGMQIVSLIGGQKEGRNEINQCDTNFSFKKKITVEISVPHFKYADRIQEVHIKIIHILILLIEKEMLNEF